MTRFENLLVWGGGAVFVLSLAACAYVYLIVWATPAAGGGWAAVATDVTAFAFFALHHSLLAREPIKRFVSRVVPEALLRTVYVWTASLLLLLVLAIWQRVGGDVYHISGWRAAGPAAVQFGGLWITALSVARIDPLELAGIRPEQHTAPDGTVQTAGPYRWVRHPIYLGWILMVFGAAHMTADRFTFAAITTAYVVLAVPWEERSLLRSFGPSYARYQRTVRWRIVPFVY
ncbi:MAG TPA: isoprenylcysteine carboxylmethyltransferase family protein [Vicinamibacterales bacterium]|jgi:protein-S-isoprenylcysteine O-methyltransferase Ste14|nr:isoprenylcysteine carboxylmethyltransferase family protein [Vicinamibacterales bacterium]